MKSIPKIYRLGERFTQGIFDGPVVIEEKIDGSQFSFGVEDGGLFCRSKSAVIDLQAPGMFQAGVNTARALFQAGKLENLWVYQCEYLAKPKHNVLAYDRPPNNNLVLFDVRSPSFYAPVELKREIAATLGLEPVPVLFEGKLSEFDAPEKINALMNTHSVLGGQKIEGVVIKNYGRSHGERENHPLTAKVVSEQFKERQASRPAKPQAQQGDKLQGILNSLRTEARWLKAIQHLRDAGVLTDTAKDIGPLLAELKADTFAEETDWIKEELFKAFQSDITRGITEGFPQWYLKLIASGGMSVYQNTLISGGHDEIAEGPTAAQCNDILGKPGHY